MLVVVVSAMVVLVVVVLAAVVGTAVDDVMTGVVDVVGVNVVVVFPTLVVGSPVSSGLHAVMIRAVANAARAARRTVAKLIVEQVPSTLPRISTWAIRGESGEIRPDTGY